jgi:protease-4
MKVSFFKMLLASIVGVFIAMFLIWIITAGMVAGMLSGIGGSKAAYILSDNTVLQLDLSGSISDRASPEFMSGLSGSSDKSVGLDDILKAIAMAKENDKVCGMYIKTGRLSAGYATLEPIRKALVDFRESGKFVIAYGDYYTQRAYYASSVADKVVMNPQGMFMFRGMSSNMPFIKEMYEKLGIRFQAFRVGTFKSAVEPYTETKMSDANREQMTSFFNCVWSHLLAGISESRGITVDNLNRYADEYMDFSAAEKSVEYGLVDTLMYAPDVKEYIKKLVGAEKIKYATVANLNSVPSKKQKPAADKIAVLYAEGVIVPGESKNYQMDNQITDEEYVKELGKLKDDKAVKAVVFRVNSPGGSGYVSEQIWRAVSELKKEKPVVVSMGDYAASGGYYISCAADVIVAEPTTLTGSIGGFSLIPEGEILFKKIGFTFDGVKTNKHSDFGAGFLFPAKPFNNDERRLMQDYTERFVDVFYTRCADGRSKTKAEIDVVGQGRVWTGKQALQNGLIDRLGSLDDAIKIAAERAELTDYDVNSYPEIKDPFTRFMEGLKGGAVKARFIKSFLGDDMYRNYLITNAKTTPLDFIQALIFPIEN